MQKKEGNGFRKWDRMESYTSGKRHGIALKLGQRQKHRGFTWVPIWAWILATA